MNKQAIAVGVIVALSTYTSVAHARNINAPVAPHALQHSGIPPQPTGNPTPGNANGAGEIITVVNPGSTTTGTIHSSNGTTWTITNR